MTYQEKQAYLQQYQEAKSRVTRIDIQLRQLRLDTMMPSIQSDGMPHAHNPHGLETYVEQYDDLSRQLVRAKQECLEVMKEISYNIDQMKGTKEEKNVLFYRYIAGLKWGDVADAVGYSRQHVSDRKRIYGQAIKNFNPSVVTKLKNDKM